MIYLFFYFVSLLYNIIYIDFLSILCHFKILLYDTNLFFHILKHIQSYMNFVNWITPANRIITTTTIECIKRGHPQGLLVSIIISELFQWAIIFPLSLLVHHIHPQDESMRILKVVGNNERGVNRYFFSIVSFTS